MFGRKGETRNKANRLATSGNSALLLGSGDAPSLSIAGYLHDQQDDLFFPVPSPFTFSLLAITPGRFKLDNLNDYCVNA